MLSALIDLQARMRAGSSRPWKRKSSRVASVASADPLKLAEQHLDFGGPTQIGYACELDRAVINIDGVFGLDQLFQEPNRQIGMIRPFQLLARGFLPELDGTPIGSPPSLSAGGRLL